VNPLRSPAGLALQQVLRGGLSLRVLCWVCITSFWLFAERGFLLAFEFPRGAGKDWAVADDVYITASFSRTLMEGGGPRWYPDAPKLEGFSSPTWVVMLALVQSLPGFRSSNLGLYTSGLNGLLLAACAWLVVATLAESPDEASSSGRPTLVLASLVCAVSGVSMCNWAAAGFEAPLVAAACLAAYRESVRSGGARALRVGLWTAMALATRLDAMTCCAGTLLLSAARLRGRDRVVALGIPGLCLAGMFLARHWYYGEWLPNTYYLKGTGWLFRDRFWQGWIQNSPVWLLVVVVLLPAILVLAPSLPHRSLAFALAPLSAFLLSVVYSTNVGGDLAFEVYGYDRFTAVGALFLPIGVVGLLTPPAGGGHTLARTGCGLIAALVPVAVRPSFEGRVHFREPGHAWLSLAAGPVRPDSKDVVGRWIDAGRAVEAATRPGALVAVCAAGAPIYFSRRRGLDLLGKIDERVARLPVRRAPPPDARCWRGFPGVGHNKEDVRSSFRAAPDLSMVAPPAALSSQYVRVSVDSVPFWARVGSPEVRWDALKRL